MTEEQHARLECLHIVSRSCGEDVAYKYVLEAAERYWQFIIGKKAELKVVPSNDEAGDAKL